VAKAWGGQLVLALRDTSEATLEEQVPVLVRALETGEAERPSGPRRRESAAPGSARARWEEARKEAFTKLAYERNAQRLRDELARRDAAAAMNTAVNPGCQWLFPGQRAGPPLMPLRLRRQLHELGIPVTQARTASFRQLVL